METFLRFIADMTNEGGNGSVDIETLLEFVKHVYLIRERVLNLENSIEKHLFKMINISYKMQQILGKVRSGAGQDLKMAHFCLK